MKLRSLSTAVAASVFALAVAGCSGSDTAASSAGQAGPPAIEALAQADTDAHADPGPMPVLADGQRWQTDEPLRKAMGDIRDDVATNLPAYHDAQLQPADADALASAVQRNIDYMIANCELAPEPDAVLHVMIGRMMGAISALREDPASADGIPQLVAVVNDYRASFDHEGLQPLTHD